MNRRTYSATVKGDLFEIATRLRMMTARMEVHVAANLVHRGLMFGPWWFMAMVWLIRRTYTASAFQRISMWFERMPDVAGDVVNDTANHMIFGKDTEDQNSAGGFSQRELDMIVSFLGLRP